MNPWNVEKLRVLRVGRARFLVGRPPVLVLSHSLDRYAGYGSRSCKACGAIAGAFLERNGDAHERLCPQWQRIALSQIRRRKY